VLLCLASSSLAQDPSHANVESETMICNMDFKVSKVGLLIVDLGGGCGVIRCADGYMEVVKLNARGVGLTVGSAKIHGKATIRNVVRHDEMHGTFAGTAASATTGDDENQHKSLSKGELEMEVVSFSSGWEAGAGGAFLTISAREDGESECDLEAETEGPATESASESGLDPAAERELPGAFGLDPRSGSDTTASFSATEGTAVR
jgi:hypothetical protein